jgi:hypothetical protein
MARRKRSCRNGSVGYCVMAFLTRTKVHPQTAVVISKKRT